MVSGGANGSVDILGYIENVLGTFNADMFWSNTVDGKLFYSGTMNEKFF